MMHNERYGMLSLEDIAAVKTAIEICNNPRLKSAMLFVETDKENINECDQYRLKKQWNEKMETEATAMLKTLDLHTGLSEAVLNAVLPIGMRMLTWAKYHGVILGFSRKTSINIINSSFFTQQGQIDNKKAAEWLMNDKKLSIEQKYKLACIYCFTDQISTLYQQIRKSNNSYVLWFKSFGLVDLWSNMQMCRIKKKCKVEALDHNRLEQSIEIGSRTAVEYCLEKTTLQRNDRILDTAAKAVNSKIIAHNDWIVFRDCSRIDSKTLWVPKNYYIDILCYLLTKMSVDQRREFLKRDVEGILYEGSGMHSRVLKHFLNWPYQDYFMKTAELTWEFLRESTYLNLFVNICYKIESEKYNIYYFEERSYNYRKLLKEFWCKSPERYKKYLFAYREGTIKFEVHYLLLMKLFLLKKFTDEDEEMIMLILSSVTDEEKENMVSSLTFTRICITCMEKDYWIVLDRIFRTCFSSKEQANVFKKELIFDKRTIRLCIDIIEKNKWSSATSFMRWSDLSKEELEKFKREMINEIISV